MRQVTKESINAFNNNSQGSFGGNTRIVVDNEATKLYLFDNLIAVKENNVIRISNAGWESNTTKERLNALSGVNIVQKKGTWYLNGNEWSGDWIAI
jgi:hypothetical protein